jgi:NAD(P)-dependent dehydrogenase (short-subunit alcohol dehydrogenase family)
VAAGEAALASPAFTGGDYAGRADLVKVLELDLEALASVKALAASLNAEPALDLVLLNAGVMALETLQHTPHGFEKQIGTNHHGHHLLVSLLRARLVSADKPVRVVFVSSTAHTRGSVDAANLHFAPPRKYSPWTAYGQSKLANLLEAKELADQLAATRVVALSLHPGVIATNLARHISLLQGDGVGATLARTLMRNLIIDKTIPQGASTSLFALLEPSLAEPALRGSYLSDCAVATPNDEGVDAAKTGRRALWAATEEQLAAALAKAGL